MNNISLVLVIIVIILLAFIGINREKFSKSCTGCLDKYNECMHKHRTVEELEKCSRILCDDNCNKCNDSIVDCNVTNTSSLSCKDSISVPQSCLDTDPTGIYFDPEMCVSDMIKTCSDPDTHRELCDKKGTFVQDGQTPCCDACKDFYIPINKRRIKPCPPNNSIENFGGPGDQPPFMYPSYIQQPPGNAGWGYRDQNATYKTLCYEQNQPILLMPKDKPQEISGYHSHMVESYPVPIKTSKGCRPPICKVKPRAQSTAPYASW